MTKILTQLTNTGFLQTVSLFKSKYVCVKDAARAAADSRSGSLPIPEGPPGLAGTP